MTFAENINRICAEQNTTLTAVCKRLGLSTSKVTTWNNGALPKESVMVQLAQELQCSVMDFFADEEDLPAVQPKDADEEDILRVYRGLSRRDKHEFMTAVYEFESRANRQELQGDKGQTAG
jgi:transcriptional regulator with XRE-family HTH domain|nr:MAG TPA: repressor protein [Caudoviricetes sp.]